MANPEVTSVPAERPLTASDVRAHFRLLETAEDGLLELYIDAAVTYAETWLRRSFVSRQYRFHLPGFHDHDEAAINPCLKNGEIWLPRPPLISVEAVKYYDEDGDDQTVDSADYQTDTVSEPGRIKPAVDASWPGVQTSKYSAVRVEYTAGYANAAAVPENFKMILRWIVALWFRNREPVAPADLREVPHTVSEFIQQFKVFRVG